MIRLQELLFGSSDKSESARLARMEKKGIIHKIAPRIYTSNFEEAPGVIIRRNWFRILSNHYPGILLSHRSALEFAPADGGHVFLTHTYTRNIRLPGLTIHFLEGPTKQENDNVFYENLFASQEARAMLENMQETRSAGELPKTLSTEQIEERLDLLIRSRGEDGINQLRDRARELAPVLGMEKEFIKLNKLVSDLLTTGSSKNLRSPLAIARSLGEPFDPERIKIFETLYGALSTKTFPSYKDRNESIRSYRNFAFFESYFSNYIEGTEFTVSEALQIIQSETPLPDRDEDSHDVLGTYQIVSDRKEMRVTPESANGLLQLLRSRHATLLRARLAKKPGQFKDKNNRAGNTEFVDWQLVAGTLKKGFDWYTLLKDPFAKAVYIMFLISEVHPFLDGNGRIARVMMNAELSSKGLSKIIIPTVFREDYMGALRKLTRQHDPAPYIRMLLRTFEFSYNVYGESEEKMEMYLMACNAFDDPEISKLIILPQ
ncbi:MAG: Fic family protein [Dyadobacter sp.]|uniref:Fic family protein n=1 Tax=Dyadobacter sp. TaxID=1914288 RepID=UPI0032678CEF